MAFIVWWCIPSGECHPIVVTKTQNKFLTRLVIIHSLHTIAYLIFNNRANKKTTIKLKQHQIIRINKLTRLDAI